MIGWHVTDKQRQHCGERWQSTRGVIQQEETLQE